VRLADRRRASADADPRHLYHDVAVALDIGASARQRASPPVSRAGPVRRAWPGGEAAPGEGGARRPNAVGADLHKAPG